MNEKTYTPESPVTVFRVSPVATCVAVISTPAITEPDVSSTSPKISVDSPPCASRQTTASKNENVSRNIRMMDLLIDEIDVLSIHPQARLAAPRMTDLSINNLMLENRGQSIGKPD